MAMTQFPEVGPHIGISGQRQPDGGGGGGATSIIGAPPDAPVALSSLIVGKNGNGSGTTVEMTERPRLSKSRQTSPSLLADPSSARTAAAVEYEQQRQPVRARPTYFDRLPAVQRIPGYRTGICCIFLGEEYMLATYNALCVVGRFFCYEAVRRRSFVIPSRQQTD